MLARLKRAAPCRNTYNGAADLFSLTPYDVGIRRGKYVLEPDQQPDGDLWRAAIYPDAVPVSHFKWHAGVLRRWAGFALAQRGMHD